MFNQQTCGEIEQPGNSSPAQILGSNGTTNGWPFYEFEPVLGVNHYKPHLFLSSEKLLASPNPAPKGLTMSHRSSWKLWVRRAHLWSTSTGAHLQCQPMRLKQGFSEKNWASQPCRWCYRRVYVTNMGILLYFLGRWVSDFCINQLLGIPNGPMAGWLSNNFQGGPKTRKKWGGYLLIPFFDKLMAGNSAGNEPWVFRSGEEVM